MATPEEHIALIRKTKFSIGGEPNPLTEDLHQAVRNLSAELYAKDVHFLMELIQNAEDNEYLGGVDPSLEIVITSRDITATGAPATLLMFNNEKGFSSKNIDSICSVGRSTKKGNRRRGYIGEKGIGFKSVFLISSQPCIFSNGYQIRFNEAPCPHCGLGYIVPEWIDENPTLDEIKKVYGLSSALPATIIVLPLKPEKVKPVKQQLSSVEPEVLLFLSKIKRLSVREDNEDPKLNTVRGIAITSETNFVTRKNIDAVSYTLVLSTKEKADNYENICSYHIWKQRFPVKLEHKVERRVDVEELMITLAFPIQERLKRGMKSPGVYAFLPTEMVTNFPFIIQADFVLSSSRETILLDNKWNQGILDCVPTAFVSAFISLVKMNDMAPVSTLCRMFNFLPINSSVYQNFNAVREAIRSKLVNEDILPSDESCTAQKYFHKPSEIGRILPAFWDIVLKARKEGFSFHNLSSHGTYVLHSSFDMIEYDNILNFLGVGYVDKVWYAKCIKSSNLVLGVSEDVYIDLLLFLAENWKNLFNGTAINNIPILKYVDCSGSVSLCTVSEHARSSLTLCRSKQSVHVSWLIDWNREFCGVANHFFLPESMQNAILSCFKKDTILEWLQNQAQVISLSVYNYAAALFDKLGGKPKIAVTYAHFLYHSSCKEFVTRSEVVNLCDSMPLVDNYGNVNATNRKILVPARRSKWNSLVGSNPLKAGGYIELGEEYLHPSTFAGQFTPGGKLLKFLGSHVAVLDIPSLSPPNAAIPAVSSPLSKENTFLLLDWIRDMQRRRTPMPEKFLTSIKSGNWLRVTINGSSGYKSPAESFSYSSSWGDILQNGSVFVDIPLIDKSFYGETISNYREELQTIGVMFEYREACKFIGDHLMRLASSSILSKDRVLSILGLIKYLRTKYLPPDEFICSIKEGRWLKTTCGYRSPVEAVLYDDEWKTAKQLCDVPFIDQGFYGDEILGFKAELGLLGVIVGFTGCHQLVVDNLKQSSQLVSFKADAFILSLECMRYAKSPDRVVSTLRGAKCLKTNLGYKIPSECFVVDQSWGCFLEVFSCFPIIECSYYGINFSCYKNELKRLGAVVDFEVAVKSFISIFRQRASLSSVTKDNVFSFLSCYRQLNGTPYKFPSELVNCIHEVKWLRTRLCDFRSPRECILFGPEWESIASISLLPFIDDNFYGKDIYKYRHELKRFGVVVEFETGVKFVPSCLCFPRKTDSVSPGSVLSLLKCLKILLKDNPFSEEIRRNLSKDWLKTYVGYASPGNCLLFDEKSDLKPTDGPFIDEVFYGSEIRTYMEVLSSIGVIVDGKKQSTLLARHLYMHSDFATIIRIYNFLAKAEPLPDNVAKRLIWIPDGDEHGRWVEPHECVLHDKDGLFGLQFNVLEKHYKNKVPLHFFSGAFGVRSNPSLDDYCKLWKGWETSGHRLLHVECCAFWKFVMQHKSSKMEQMLSESLGKVPVDSGSDGIVLVDKNDVFIADDLRLRDRFVQSSFHRLFVWYPQPSLPFLPQTRLFELYMKIGVRVISESVQKKALSITNGQELKQIKLGDGMIGKGLLRIILGFLACSSMNLEADKRHEAVQSLLNLTVFETSEPVAVAYTLSLSSGETLEVRASRMVRWDRECSKFFIQKMDESAGKKDQLEYATYFSETVAEGLLWENEDQISSLSELIKLAFLLKFNEDAVDFLMKSNNLEVYVEDEEFLSAAFPSEQV